MSRTLDRAVRVAEVAVVALAAVGAAIVVVQMLWISYGVFMRYAMARPDRLVTEATALLLFPVAFAGLAYAMREDAYPRVTLLTDALPPGVRKLLGLLNFAIMAGIGVFLSITTVSATLRAYDSGAASEILQWPRWLFWSAGAVSLVLFTVYAVLRLAQLALRPADEKDGRDGVV